MVTFSRYLESKQKTSSKVLDTVMASNTQKYMISDISVPGDVKKPVTSKKLGFKKGYRYR